ncbi:hypothetical protein L0128_02760 [candidate division KSB1 bacterium]|nr:hypothetical protein [candidate division KSB1 bacterium]
MKKSGLFWILLVNFQFIFSPASFGQVAFPPVAYEELFQQFLDLKPNAEQTATVVDFEFTRDVARFTLKKGLLVLLTPIAGRTAAAMFTGEGNFSFTPPTDIEKDQLYRYYKTRTLERKFKFLLLIFADSTRHELGQHLAFSSANLKKDLIYDLDNLLDYVRIKKSKDLPTGLAQTFLNHEENGFFYASFFENPFEPLFFMIDPTAVEEVSFMRRAKTPVTKESEVICQFHQQADYHSSQDLSMEEKDPLEVRHYQIESTIRRNLDFSAQAEVEFVTLKSVQEWIYFYLYQELKVDSVFWEQDVPATFFRGKENPVLWVKCDPPIPRHAPRKLKIYYHGDLIEGIEDWFALKAPYLWYPVTMSRETASYDLTFHTHENYDFVSVGDLKSTEINDKVKTTHWVTPKPVHSASFAIGNFDEFEIQDTRIPPITVMITQRGHQELAQYFIQAGILSGANMEKQVGADIANSLSFFQDLYGPYPVNKIYAVETPYLHGLAFPGFIRLAWTTFQRTERGYDEAFRAHEVAHQWWGLAVNFKTYHDQWLSEGLAEFSGLWYMQSVLKDNQLYFRMLKEYRDEIFSNRKWQFIKGDQAGPIWLGYRTGSTTSEADYSLMIYKKGAWVFHMLRTMLLDQKTMNEDVFKNMLRDYYATYRDQKATTRDFQRMVEKHTGAPMDWFFNQWIYGTDLPTYHCAYKINETSDGKYQVRGQIRQENVPENFKMYLPLLIDFGQGRNGRLRIKVEGPRTQFDLPPLTECPQAIIFNDLESVLCKIEMEKWKE